MNNNKWNENKNINKNKKEKKQKNFLQGERKDDDYGR